MRHTQAKRNAKMTQVLSEMPIKVKAHREQFQILSGYSQARSNHLTSQMYSAARADNGSRVLPSLPRTRGFQGISAAMITLILSGRHRHTYTMLVVRKCWIGGQMSPMNFP